MSTFCRRVVIIDGFLGRKIIDRNLRWFILFLTNLLQDTSKVPSKSCCCVVLFSLLSFFLSLSLLLFLFLSLFLLHLSLSSFPCYYSNSFVLFCCCVFLIVITIFRIFSQKTGAGHTIFCCYTCAYPTGKRYYRVNLKASTQNSQTTMGWQGGGMKKKMVSTKINK